MRIVRIAPRERAAFQARLAALEQLAAYPLGQDSFRLDHGPDYFAFFDRLGDVLYAAALQGEQLAAVGCGMLRRVPFRAGEAPRRAWYIADLKVHPDHRGGRIPLRVFGRFFPWHYPRCPRGYGISMNPGDGRENKVVRLFGHWRWSPVSVPAQLLLWSLDQDAARRALPIIERHRGPVSLRSLAGIKDLVLGSTGQPMKLLHAEWDRPAGADPARDGRVVDGPQADHVHMVCAPEQDALAVDLRALGLAPSATASILAHRMPSDWRFIVTSEI